MTGYIPPDALYVNVKDFGAKGDSLNGPTSGTDDTAAIQRAVSYLKKREAHSSVLHFPYGGYRTSEIIDFENLRGFKMMGDGRTFDPQNYNTSLPDHATRIWWTGQDDADAMIITQGNNWNFENFGLFGGGTDRGKVSGGSGGALRGIWVRNQTGLGSGIAHMDMIACRDLRSGIVCGPDGGASSTSNAADITFGHMFMRNCDDGIRTTSQQNVQYQIQMLHTWFMQNAVNCIEGGNFDIGIVAMIATQRVFNVPGDGNATGTNNGLFTAHHCRWDSNLNTDYLANTPQLVNQPSSAAATFYFWWRQLWNQYLFDV